MLLAATVAIIETLQTTFREALKPELENIIQAMATVYFETTSIFSASDLLS